MQLHGNAALSLKQRRRLAGRVVDQCWTLTEAAEAAEVSVRTARKWVRRYRAEGESGLLDRSSRPRRCPRATSAERVRLIALLRRATRMTGAEIAEALAMPLKTVQGILTRLGLGKRWRLEQRETVRYERARPGELVHIDVKKLGRIACGPPNHRPQALQPDARPARSGHMHGRLGVLPHRDRRLQPARLRRAARRRTRRDRGRLPAARAPLLRRPGRPRRASDDR